MFSHKEELKKRFIAFLWHTGAMVGIAFLSFASSSIGLFDLPNWGVVLVGLGVAQGTKYLKNYLNS